MKLELQQALYAKYPEIFKNKDADKTKSCMFWGLECGDGWYSLLDNLCYALSNTYSTGFWDDQDNFMEVVAPQVVADTVKEKYASLRFYYHLDFSQTLIDCLPKSPKAREIMDAYQNYFDGIVHMAECLSQKTCEITGKEGEIHVSGGWYRTLNKEFAQTDPDCVKRGWVLDSELSDES